MNSASPQSCPQCGKPLPTAGGHRLCPACLMAQAIASGTVLAGGAKPGAVPPPSPETIADKFPQFEILECLGRGGMGVVYKARQKSLNRTVAIKILAPEREHDARFAARFAREAELLARLSHPHIVTIHDFGQADGLFYIVMEFVDGVNLRDLLREGKVEPRQALAIVPPVCEALQYAHDHGVVHRDIKPENLLLDREGRVKIADFGIASLVGAEGESAGTPPYMAPELGGAKPAADHRADIYALGVVLYEMLTGERPGREVVAPSRKVQIDVRLDEIVLRALEKQPEARYASAMEFKTQVETVAHTPPAAASVRPAPLAGLLKFARARVTWQTGEAETMIAPSTGEVGLHGDRLVLSSGPERREVSLAAVRLLGEAVAPAWWSPAGHRYVVVEYEEAGRLRRVAFLPGVAPFRTVGSSHLAVAEWLAALRGAIQTAAGRDIAPAQGILRLPLAAKAALVWLIPSLPVGIILLGALLSRGSGGGLSLAEKFLASLAMVFWPLLALGGVLIARMVSLRSGPVLRSFSDRDRPPPPQPVSRFSFATLVGVVLAGMVLAGLGFVVAGLIWFRAGSPRPPASASTVATQPLLRVTVRVIEVPADFDEAQLLRPSGLLDSGEVKILAAPYVVVASGSEGTIPLPPIREGSPGAPVLSGRTRTLFVKPFLEPGTAHVRYMLEGLVSGVGAEKGSETRRPIRSDSLQLGELQTMESDGLPDGRRQLALISVEMAVPGSAMSGNAAPAVASATLAGTAFGPVVERVLTDVSEHRGSEALSFADGRVLSLPAPARQLDARHGWMEANQADLLLDFVANRRLTVVSGLKLADWPGERWDDVTPADLARALESEAWGLGRMVGSGEQEYWMTKEPLFPVTLAFASSRGERGLLQLTGFAEGRQGMKIRYKLVRGGAASALTARPGSAEITSAFRDYAVDRTFEELAKTADPDTPEKVQAVAAFAVLAGDAAGALGRYTLDVPPVPAGGLAVTLTEQGKTDIRQARVLRTVIYRDDLALVIARQPGGLTSVVHGRRDGHWRIFVGADLPEAATEAEAVANFKAKAPAFLDALRKLPAEPSGWFDEASRLAGKMDEAAKELTKVLGGGVGQLTAGLTKGRSQAPGHPDGWETNASGDGVTRGFLREPGVHTIDAGGSRIEIAPASGGRLTLSLIRVDGGKSETVALPEFVKGDGWFAYAESADRVWIFDGMDQLDALTPRGRYSAGDLGVRAFCPAVVWTAVPAFVRERLESGGPSQVEAVLAGGVQAAASETLSFGGVEWQTWRTLFEVRDGSLVSLPRVRPGFDYGHWGHGRGPEIITNIGNPDWRDYRIEARLRVPGVDPALNPHGLGLDFHGAMIAFHVVDRKESFNERGTSAYILGFEGEGNWSLAAHYNNYCRQPQGWGSWGGDGERKLASGSDAKLNRAEGNRLRIELRGKRIRVWLDERQLVDLVDEQMDERIGGQTLDHGGVAFVGGFDAMIRLEEFSLTRLDDRPDAAGL